MEKRSLSIRMLIMLYFIGTMMTTVVVVGYMVFSNWYSSADASFSEMAEDLNAVILQEVDSFITLPLHINEANQASIRHGIVDLTNEIERERFFVNVLDTHNGEQVYSFSYGTATGEYYGARRNPRNVIEIMRNNAETGGHSWYYAVSDQLTAGERVVEAGRFDPRTRDWYQAAAAAQGPMFSPIYKHFVMDDLTVSAAYPIYNDDGTLHGVLGTHIILSKINNYLQEITEKKSALAVIVERGTGHLIANSLGVRNFEVRSDGSYGRLSVTEFPDPVAGKAFQSYLEGEGGGLAITEGSERYQVNVTGYNRQGLDWLIITAVPARLFMAGIFDNMRLTLLLTLLALVISIVVYLRFTNKFLQPIDGLIDAASKLSQGDLSQRAPVIRNDEVGRIARSFNSMADTIDQLVHNLESRVKERTSELLHTYNVLKEKEEQLRLILDSTAEAIYGIDKQGRCTFCNASCLRLLKYEHEGQLIGRDMHQTIHHSRRDGLPFSSEECPICKALQMGKAIQAEDEVFWRADGTYLEVAYRSHPQFKDGELVGAVVTFSDNTERKRAAEEIKYLSYHDSLTGLYNRTFFDEELKRLDTARNLPISIIVGDMNGLKLTNDVFGHAAGDELIKKVAAAFKGVCRADDIIARTGGDEFAILLPKTTAEETQRIMERIQKRVSEEKVRAVRGGISMGHAIKEDSAQDVFAVMRRAEDRMYHAKTIESRSFAADAADAIIRDLHERSPREKAHSLAVRDLAKRIGAALGLPEDDIARLGKVGYLHDIGKVALDDDLLEDPDTLTESQVQERQKHPVVGYRILNSFDETMDLAEDVLAHHERWDGSGYPKGLQGEEIPLLARIVAIAERFDSLTNQHQKDPMTATDAIEVIKMHSGIDFEPRVVEAFQKIMSDGNF